MESQPQSRLLTLPPELRNRIWHEALSSPSREPFHLENGHMEPGLLSTNRQIRSECSGMFYANNILSFSDPKICVWRISTIPSMYVDLIPELRFDTSEKGADAMSWRTAFRQLPGLDQTAKMEKLRDELMKHGISLRSGALKCRVLMSCGPVWTSDPLAATFNAVKSGMMVGPMMFV